MITDPPASVPYLNVIQLQGNVAFTNYSQEYILVQTWDTGRPGYLQEIFILKKRTYAELNPSPVPALPEYYPYPNNYISILQVIGVIEKYTNPVITFAWEQVQSPSSHSSPEELVRILNGWFDGGGVPISVNGGVPVDPLYGINFIEGANISISVAQNLPNNQTDVTISAAGGGGGFSYTTVAVNTTPYAVVPITGWYMYLVDATAGNITINFPSAVGNNAVYTVKKVDASANTVILTPNGLQTIDGAATQTIRFQNTSVDIYSDNANLYIM